MCTYRVTPSPRAISAIGIPWRCCTTHRVLSSNESFPMASVPTPGPSPLLLIPTCVVNFSELWYKPHLLALFIKLSTKQIDTLIKLLFIFIEIILIIFINCYFCTLSRKIIQFSVLLHVPDTRVISLSHKNTMQGRYVHPGMNQCKKYSNYYSV